MADPQDILDFAAYTGINSQSPSSPDAVPLAGVLSDTVDLVKPIRGIRATGAGNVVVTTASGNTRTLAFLAGETRMVACTRVWLTATTATGLDGLI